MAGVRLIQVQEGLEDLAARLRQEQDPRVKERLQVLYWLKQENAPSNNSIAKAIGRNRSTLQEWLATYRRTDSDAGNQEKSWREPSHPKVGRRAVSVPTRGT
jgi:transposase-like protein